MSNGPTGLCRHVWETKCRTCGTDLKDWPELGLSLRSHEPAPQHDLRTLNEVCLGKPAAPSSIGASMEWVAPCVAEMRREGNLAFADAVEALAARSAIESPAWIAVTDRKPPNDWTPVWTYGDDSDGTHQWASHGHAFHDPAWLIKYAVTHWMPLPSAPTDGTANTTENKNG